MKNSTGTILYSGNEKECFLVSTPSGRVIFTSGSLRSMLGYDLVGRNLNDFLSDEITTQIIISSTHGEIFNFECDISKLHFKGRLDSDKNEIVIVFTPFSRIISLGLNKNTAQLISRDINQSTSLLLGAISTLEKTDNTNALCSIKQNAFKLLRLSNNISDYSLCENGTLGLNLACCDIVAFCRKLFEKVTPLFSDSGINFNLNLPDEPVMCNFDNEKIERVIYNFLSNSISSIKNDGEISFTLSTRDSFVHMSIKDSGKGMNDDQISSISKKHILQDASNPKSAGGAGFGFCLAQAFVEMHGGSILFFSMPDRGTTINITLPTNMDKAKTQMHSINVDYAGGYDASLLELSQVLPLSAYKK